MTGEDLRSILESARPQLESGLAAAESELQALEERRAGLLALISQARAALGQSDASSPSRADERRLTLHEALALVLRENGNEPMTARELTDQVNVRSLYRRRDGSPVEANQVHARTKNYPNLFEKHGSRIRLRDA
jgi:HB1, ASXL, restriction endonuclease HTH domain